MITVAVLLSSHTTRWIIVLLKSNVVWESNVTDSQNCAAVLSRGKSTEKSGERKS